MNKHLNKIIPFGLCCICGRRGQIKSPSGRWFCMKDDCKKPKSEEEVKN